MAAAPLSGYLVVDLSRMLPGAILARQLLDLGARVVKVEEPGLGDILRHLPPLADGIGAGFASLLRGAESVTLDLRSADGAAAVRRLAEAADVVVESFRPGTLERWELGPQHLRRLNPELVVCSLAGFAAADGGVGHDLNFTALSGALELLGPGVPGVQLADVGAGLLAASAVLAALLARPRSGGRHLIQPLAAGPLPFIAWQLAEQAAGGLGPTVHVLSGRVPAYRRYRCSDGLELAVGAIEPKFWVTLVEILELPHLAGAGLDFGPGGEAAAQEVAAAFARRPRAAWLAAAAERGLPVTAVNDLAAALAEPALAPLLERSASGSASGIGPLPHGVGTTPGRPAPALGEHTHAVLAELGLA